MHVLLVEESMLFWSLDILHHGSTGGEAGERGTEIDFGEAPEKGNGGTEQGSPAEAEAGTI